MIETNAILGIVLAAALMLVVQGPWQWFCTDRTRHLLFVQRNRLFDLAADGELSFDDEVYKGVRSHIENLIRFAHETTWFRYAVIAFGIRKEIRSASVNVSCIDKLISKIENENTKAKVKEIYNQSAKEMVFMLIRKSFLIYVVFKLTLISSRYVILPIMRLTAVGEQSGGAFWARWAAVSRDLMHLEAGVIGPSS